MGRPAFVTRQALFQNAQRRKPHCVPHLVPQV
jgi:hypothetical protein